MRMGDLDHEDFRGGTCLRRFRVPLRYGIYPSNRQGAIGRCESRSRALHCDFYSPENHPDLDDLPYVTYYEMELED